MTRDAHDHSAAKRLAEIEKADATKSHILDLLGRITAGHTEEDICRAVVEGVRELLHFERAGLFLWDDSIRTFRGTFGTDMDLKTTDEHHYVIEILPGSPEARIIAGAVIERGCKLGAPEARPDEDKVKADLVGLRVDGRLYGILSVDNRLSRRPITDLELEHLMLVSRVLGNALEISRARKALAESEERFRQVSENSGEWIWEMDAHGVYTYASPVVANILGYQPSEVKGRLFMDWVLEDDRDRVIAAIQRVLQDKQSIERFIHRQNHRDGYQVVLETAAIPMIDAAGVVRGCRGAHRDVTREHDLESQLRHSQKMEAIGRLAGGIAHDFNNLLTAILGCGSLLLEELRTDDPVRNDIETIRTAGERAAGLTRQLLAFSRRQVLHVEKVNLAEVVKEMEKLLRRTIGEDIEFLTRLDSDLPLIETDSDQLQQVILHLVINARDAMIDPHFMARTEQAREELLPYISQMAKKPKQLLIETSKASLDEMFCRKHVGLNPGLYVTLAVRDTGIGMSREIQSHLFEPFFTTREVGKGSGLGLSTVYGIVKQMGGHIRVDSRLGEGSTFTVYLPLSSVPRAKAADEKKEGGSPRGQETILVVEDEDVVRQLTVRMLQSLGYHTIQAANGAEALEMCKTYQGQIHLIVSDMIMPQMSGKQLVEELKKTGRRTQVLFVSGYSSEDTVGGEVIGADTPLIQKPFTREVLARKIRHIIDGKKTG